MYEPLELLNQSAEIRNFINTLKNHTGYRQIYPIVHKLLMELDKFIPTFQDKINWLRKQNLDVKVLNSVFNLATFHGHLDKIKYLIKRKLADPTADNNYAIRVASQNGHLEVVKYLLKTTHENQSTLATLTIFYASENNHTHIVKYLVKNKLASPITHNNRPIHMAVENGHLAVVKYLNENTQAGSTVNKNLMLCLAAQHGHLEIVKYWVENDLADPTINDNYAIRFALDNGDIATVLFLASLPAVKQTIGDGLRQKIKVLLKNTYRAAVSKALLFFQPDDKANQHLDLLPEIIRHITTFGSQLVQQDMKLDDDVLNSLLSSTKTEPRL